MGFLQTSIMKEYTGDTALKRSLNSSVYLLTFLSQESTFWYFIYLKGSHTLVSFLIHNFPSLIQNTKIKLPALEDMSCGFQYHLLYDIRPCEYKSTEFYALLHLIAHRN